MGAFFVAYALASKGYRNTRRLLLMYVLIGAIYALASNLVLLGSLLGFSTTTYSWSSQLFAGSWLNPARYLVACILILLAFLPEINKRYRVYVYIICALLMTTVITMNARTPLVSLIFCAGVVLWLSAQVVGLRPVKLMIVGLLVGIILFITLYTFLPGVASYLSRYQSTIISGQGFDNRWAFYQKFWEVWRAPVFGHGIGGWHAIAGSPHPHNMFLEVTFALGLTGLLVWITFIAMIWLRGLQPILQGKLPNRYKMLTIAALGGALNGFVASMSSGGFTDWRQQWVFWGIMLALNSSMLDYFRRTDKKA
jgi:O-antigen ligase